MVEGKQALPIPNMSLAEKDPEIYAMVQEEKMRQFHGIELIASENFTSRAVMEAMGSCLTNKYSEGYPGRRYYGGNEVVDKVELLCQKRALEVFGLDPEVWGVNVQPLSGSPANLAVYTGLVGPGGKLMGLALSNGGHLTHGHQQETEKGLKKISCSSLFFESQAYFVNQETGLIDYDGLAKQAAEFKPKLIISGASGYPRDFDYKRFREIANSVGALHMADIAHYAGLIASGLMNSPFEFCDIVTSTTHKSLRGARQGLIFFRKEHQQAIDFAVFPTLQGGPHNATIAGVAVLLKEVATEDFKKYAKQIILNAQAMAKALTDKGEKLITDGTDCHLIMWDIRPHGLTGSKLEKVLDKIHVTTNKNSIIGDKSPMNPGGIRLGTPAVTTRGMAEKEMEIIVDFMLKAVEIGKAIQEKSGKQLKDFVVELEKNEECPKIAEEVKAFSTQFSIPGV